MKQKIRNLSTLFFSFLYTDYKTTDYRATIQIEEIKIMYSRYDKVVDYKTKDYRATFPNRK